MAGLLQRGKTKESITAPGAAAPARRGDVAVFTGGVDKPYAFGLAMALSAKGQGLDFIGGAEVDSPELHTRPRLIYRDLHGKPGAQAHPLRKVLRVLSFYLRLFRYTISAKPRIFHILWNNKLELLDRTLLMLYYKLLGKKLVLTAHNVNAGKRDGNDSVLNRLTLRVQYRLVDHIFVHTELMKRQLMEEFAVSPETVTVIPFGINNSVANTELGPAEARDRLGIPREAKTILFFGAIRQYKGLDRLVSAFLGIAGNDPAYRLVVAGEPRKDAAEYVQNILAQIEEHPCRSQVVKKLEYVPDDDTELYFKAADVLVLPYVHIFQSGVLFLAYNFGLPVIATDIGSFREHIVDGRTGLLAKSADPADLARAITRYFESALFADLDKHRAEIQRLAHDRYSWEAVATTTCDVYARLLGTARAASAPGMPLEIDSGADSARP